MKILSLIFGTTIKSITSRVVMGVLLGLGIILYTKYTNAIQGFERAKVETSKLSIENKELIAYNTVLLAQKDSLRYVKSVDSTNYSIREKGLQNLIAQQRQISKEKDRLISDMTNNLKCKNIFGKIIDCK